MYAERVEHLMQVNPTVIVWACVLMIVYIAVVHDNYGTINKKILLPCMITHCSTKQF